MTYEIGKALCVFLLMLVTDFCWATTIRRIKDGNALGSATWGMLLMLLAGAATISYVRDVWMLLPTCLGSFAGTYAGVWIDTRGKRV